MYKILGGYISSVSGPFHPFGGAVDIVVVQQQDGTFKSSPWYVRFGKFQGVLKSRENCVKITVNGKEAGFHMYLDGKGEAFFLHCTDLDADGSATSSPLSFGNERSENLVEEKEEIESGKLNEGQIVKRGERRSIFQLMFGRKSSKSIGNDVNRRSSLERAEIAADLLEMKWSTNLSMKDRREFQADSENLEGQDENSRDNGVSTNGIVKEVSEREVELDSVNLGGQNENLEGQDGNLRDDGALKDGILEEVSVRGAELNSVNLGGQNENLVDNGESANVKVVEDLSVRGLELNSTNLGGQNENSAENDLEKVVIQCTDINNTEIELHEKSFTVTEQKTIREEVCVVTGVESNSTNLRGQDEILLEHSLEKVAVNSSLNNCFNGDSDHLKTEEKVTCIETIETNQVIGFNPSEINKEKSLDNSEKKDIDYIEERETNPRLSTVNSDSSDLHPPDSIDTSSDVSIDKILEASSEENSYDKIEENSSDKITENSSDKTIENSSDKIEPALEASSEEKVEISQVQNSEISVSESTQISPFESPSNKLDQEIRKTRENVSLLTEELESSNQDEKSGISFPGISIPGISNSENSEDLQFNFSDNEGKTETETDKKEGTESDNEEINSTNQARNGSTCFESSPICIPSTSGTRNVHMAISLPNLYYDMDEMEINESTERLSSSLGLKNGERENHDSLSKELVENCESNGETGRVDGSNSDTDSEKDSLINPLVELSLCKHLLYEGMGQEAARKAFDSQKITLEKFHELGPPNLIKDQTLIVRINNQYFPYDSAAPAVLSLASFGQENQQETLHLKEINMHMIRVDQVHSKAAVPAGGSWWQFGFRRSRSVSSTLEGRDGNLGEIEGVECKNGVKKVRSLTPSSDELAALGLKDGCNTVTFTFNTSMLGKQQVDARIFLWKWNTRVVISDVDGTITKSDVLGQFMPLVGVDWSQTGVTHLFSAIKDNGYQLLFLSARAISQAHLTRRFLFSLKQDGKALPDGPVVISPDGLFPSLYREVIRRAPHEFKISCLEDIKALFPSDSNPFYAGFGNRDTDELSYLKVGIPIGKIFIINPKGQVAVNRRVDTKSYSSLHELVNGMFPPYSSPEQEGYNDYNFWRLPLPEMD